MVVMLTSMCDVVRHEILTIFNPVYDSRCREESTYEWQPLIVFLQLQPHIRHSLRQDWLTTAALYGLQPSDVIRTNTDVRVWKCHDGCYAPLSITDWNQQNVFDRLHANLDVIEAAVSTSTDGSEESGSAFCILLDIVMLYHIVVEKRNDFHRTYRKRWLRVHKHLWRILRVMFDTETYRSTIQLISPPPMFTHPSIRNAYVPFFYRSIRTIECPSCYSIVHKINEYPMYFHITQCCYKQFYTILFTQPLTTSNHPLVVYFRRLKSQT